MREAKRDAIRKQDIMLALPLMRSTFIWQRTMYIGNGKCK